MKRFVWELEVLTPVHIGSGGQWTTFDYVYDPAAKLLRVVDLNKLLAQPRVNPEDLARYYERRDFQVGQYLRDRGIAPSDVESYHLPCPRDPSNGPVRVFIKTPFGKPLLVASAVKGLVRTAVLWQFLLKSSTASQKALDYLRVLLGRREKREAVGVKIERLPEALGPDPNSDLMRAVQLEDSAELPLESLEVFEVSSYLVNAQGRLERDRRLTNWVEALRSGTKVKLYGRFDEFLFSDLARELELQPKVDYVTPEGLLQTLQGFTETLVESEVAFYRERGLANVAERLQALTTQGTLLCLGWGGGWSSKTITRAFLQRPDFDFMALRRIFRLGQSRSQRDFYHSIFPKSRRLAISAQGALAPLGWVQLKVAEGW